MKFAALAVANHNLVCPTQGELLGAISVGSGVGYLEPAKSIHANLAHPLPAFIHNTHPTLNTQASAQAPAHQKVPVLL